MEKTSQNCTCGSTIRLVKEWHKGGSKERNRLTNKHAAPVFGSRFWRSIISEYLIYSSPFFFVEPVWCGKARATRRKPAKEARVRSYAIKIFARCNKGRSQVWFCGMVVVAGKRGGERCERRRCDRIKETRSTRRFFLVNFTNTYYYISLIFSIIIISNISWL